MPKIKKALQKVKEVAAVLTRDVEKQLQADFPYVVGVDEAGRGPLAGPVVCAACFLPPNIPIIAGIKDSKLTSESEREAAYELLVNHPEVVYGISIVSHTEIDEVNILQASMLGMSRATSSLLEKLSRHPLFDENKPSGRKTSKKRSFSEINKDNWKAKFIGMVDGPYVPKDFPLAAAKPVVQGDRRVYSIAAASILAKITRDRIMVEYDRQYPQYLFAKHKGYPTAEHRSLLMVHGACDIHRRSYNPVKLALQAKEKKGVEKECSLTTKKKKMDPSKADKDSMSDANSQRAINKGRKGKRRISTAEETDCSSKRDPILSSSGKRQKIAKGSSSSVSAAVVIVKENQTKKSSVVLRRSIRLQEKESSTQ